MFFHVGTILSVMFAVFALVGSERGVGSLERSNECGSIWILCCGYGYGICAGYLLVVLLKEVRRTCEGLLKGRDRA
jgi:hypothetical protein